MGHLEVCIFVVLRVFAHVKPVVPDEHDDGVLTEAGLLHGLQDPADLAVHEADGGVVGSPQLFDLTVRVGHVGLSQVRYPGSLRRAVVKIENSCEPRPGRGRHVLGYVGIAGQVDLILGVEIEELLRSVPGLVGFVETHRVEERLLASDGGGGDFIELLDKVVSIGHISQYEVLQLLVSVGVPGDVVHVGTWCVEYLLRPGGWVVVSLVSVGDPFMI